VEVYRPGREPEILEFPDTGSCEDVMPGFILSLKKIW
jgi:Uma2 family endonuclease